MDLDNFTTTVENIEVRQIGKFERVWRLGPGGSMDTSPLLVDGKLYFGSEDRNFYCLDLSGKEIWRFATEGKIFSGRSPIWKGKVYFASTDYHVYCLDMNTGEMLWKFATSNLNPTTYPDIKEGFEAVVNISGTGSEDEAEDVVIRFTFDTYSHSQM